MKLQFYTLAALLIGILYFLTSCSLFGNQENPDTEIDVCENIAFDEWVLLGLERERVTSIAVDLVNEGVIYAGTASNFSDGNDGKLYKTNNCGLTWEVLISGGSFRTIEISPDDNSEIYAINGSILKSTDHGETWELSQKGIEPKIGASIGSFILDPKNPEIQYAGTSGMFGGSFYKSTDRGETWSEIEANGLSEDRLKSGVTSIAINQVNSDHIYVGAAFVGDVLRSINAGETWEITNLYDTGSLVHDIIIYPQEGSYYAGLNKRGLYTSHDGGKTWDLVNNDLLNETTSIVDLELDTESNHLYAVLNYENTGQIIKNKLDNYNWLTVSTPVLDEGFYYSVFKVESVQGVSYQFFGLNGIYLKRLSASQ